MAKRKAAAKSFEVGSFVLGRFSRGKSDYKVPCLITAGNASRLEKLQILDIDGTRHSLHPSGHPRSYRQLKVISVGDTYTRTTGQHNRRFTQADADRMLSGKEGTLVCVDVGPLTLDMSEDDLEREDRQTPTAATEPVQGESSGGHAEDGNTEDELQPEDREDDDLIAAVQAQVYESFPSSKRQKREDAAGSVVPANYFPGTSPEQAQAASEVIPLAQLHVAVAGSVAPNANRLEEAAALSDDDDDSVFGEIPIKSTRRPPLPIGTAPAEPLGTAAPLDMPMEEAAEQEDAAEEIVIVEATLADEEEASDEDCACAGSTQVTPATAEYGVPEQEAEADAEDVRAPTPQTPSLPLVATTTAAPSASLTVASKISIICRDLEIDDSAMTAGQALHAACDAFGLPNAGSTMSRVNALWQELFNDFPVVS